MGKNESKVRLLVGFDGQPSYLYTVISYVDKIYKNCIFALFCVSVCLLWGSTTDEHEYQCTAGGK